MLPPWAIQGVSEPVHHNCYLETDNGHLLDINLVSDNSFFYGPIREKCPFNKKVLVYGLSCLLSLLVSSGILQFFLNLSLEGISPQSI